MAIRFRWHRPGFRAVLTSESVRAELGRRAARVAAAANASAGIPPGGRDAGYVSVTAPGQARARASVIAASMHARRHNAKHNTLVRELGRAAGAGR